MPANIQSETAISDFRSALCTFMVEARQALAALEMEAHRAVEYITHDQAQAWSGEVRRGREKVQQCKLEIHNTRTFKRIGHYTPSCIDEKKELAKAELRLRVADAKVEAVRHWGRVAEQAFREFQARLAQFVSILDGDLPKAVATLERLLASLDRYFAAQAPAVAPRATAELDEPRATGIADTASATRPTEIPTDADHAPQVGVGEASDGVADEHAVDPQSGEPAEASATERS